MRTILFALLLVPTIASADEANTVLNRWAAAIGGIETLRTAETIHRIADSSDDGTTGVMDEWVTRALARRELLDHTKDQTLVVFDGKTAWRRDWNGFVEQLDGADVKRQIDFAILHGVGALTGSAGPPELVSEGVIRFHPPGGRPLRYVIDQQSGLPLRAEMASFDGIMTVTFSDWRDVDGIKVPFAETEESGPSKSEIHLRSIDLHARGEVALSRPQSSPDDTVFLRNQKSERVPFNFDNNHIIILGSVNGVGPLWLLLDTGAEFTVLNQSRLAEMHVKPYGGLNTNGGGESAPRGINAENVTYPTRGVEFADQHAAILAP